MARKTRTTRRRTSPKASGFSFLRRWWGCISPDRKAGTVRMVLRVIVLCLIVIAAGLGMKWLESHVRATTRSSRNTPVRLQVSARPDWMPAELAYRIARSFATTKQARYDDVDLTDTIAARAAANSWVRKVRSVRKARDADGRPFVRADCEFRRPAAMVAWRKRFFFVDDQGVRLRDKDVPRWAAMIPGRNGGKARPEAFIDIADVPTGAKPWGIEYIVIELESQMYPAPTSPGQLWDTKALVGNGLRLTALLKTLNIRGGTPRSIRVDARNYAGRRSTVAPHLAFWAGDSYFKFGRFPEDRYHYNVSIQQKMRALKDHIARHNGKLAGTPGLNLQLENPYE